jgi:hypothetical protein
MGLLEARLAMTYFFYLFTQTLRHSGTQALLLRGHYVEKSPATKDNFIPADNMNE